MMYLMKSAFSVLLLCLVIVGATAQSKTEKSQALFHINKKPVSVEEFVYLYRKNHQFKPEDFTREKIEEYFNLFVNYKLKVEEALSRGMDTTDTFRKEYETYRGELLKPYLPDTKVIDSLVRMTYERLNEEISASHILIRLGPDATPKDTLDAYNRIVTIRKRAVSGEDFGSLAAQYSEEPGADTRRGNLGFFTALQMVYPFEQAAYLTPVGGISEPVRTQFGYHLVKVLEKRPTVGEIEVSHIMIRDEGEDDEQARQRIFDVHDRLQKGMDWNELCAEYSEDLNSKDKGGKLKPFGVGAMASIPAFQDAAFSLRNPGDITDPIRTQFGWHIIKLESRIPLPSFDELKASLTQRVSRDQRVEISKEALRKRSGFRENASVKAALSQFAGDLAEKNFSTSRHLRDSLLFELAGKKYTVGEFIKFLSSNSPSLPPRNTQQYFEEKFAAFSDRVNQAVLEERVRKESPSYTWLLKEYYEGILLFEIMEKEVWNRAMEDSVGQRKYFDSHPGKYMAGERMAGTIYQSLSKLSLERLNELLIAGDYNAIQSYIAANHIRVDSGAFERKDRSWFTRVAWEPGTYMIENNGPNLVVFHKRIPPGPQTFEEARASIITDYQSVLEDSWIQELKRKFAVKVDKKAKKRAFAQLMDNKGE